MLNGRFTKWGSQSLGNLRLGDRLDHQAGCQGEGNKEKPRHEKKGERDIFYKVAERVAYGVRVQNLFDESQGTTG